MHGSTLDWGHGENASSLKEAAQRAIEYVQAEGRDGASTPLTESQFIVLSYLFRLGKMNVYSLHQSVKEDRDRGNPSARLALQTAYRATDWLKERKLIEEVGEEFSSRNGIRMPVYGITEEGRRILIKEIARMMLLSLSGLLKSDQLEQEVHDEASV